jgi:RHS repeat-associated protein
MLTSDGLAPRLGVMLTRVTGTRATYTLTYNRAGNRLTEASTITGDPGNGTATTSYDPLDRLASYGLPSINRTLGAGFDAVPNRTTLTTDGTPVTTTFDPANRPTSGGYQYDDDGRMTTRAGSNGTTLSYDSLGRLAEVRADPGDTLVARYGYDAMDRLLTVERPGRATVRFRYAGTTTAVAQVYNETAGTVERNATVGPEGTVLADWLGTSQRLYGTNGHHDTTFTTDGAGTVTATLRYDPWGNVLRSGGSLPEWRFQGSWADTVTGLAWSIARWYDPVQGTFITQDTLLGSPDSPASRHLYAYGQGDPVGSWDPSGQDGQGLTFDNDWATGWVPPGGSCTLSCWQKGVKSFGLPGQMYVWAQVPSSADMRYEGRLDTNDFWFKGSRGYHSVRFRLQPVFHWGVDWNLAGGSATAQTRTTLEFRNLSNGSVDQWNLDWVDDFGRCFVGIWDLRWCDGYGGGPRRFGYDFTQRLWLEPGRYDLRLSVEPYWVPWRPR